MTLTADETLSMRLSIRDLPSRDGAEMLRESYGRTVLRAEIEPTGEGPAHFDMDLCAMPGLGMANGACSPFSVHRTNALIDNDDLVLLIALEGATVMRHRGQEERIESGQALLMMNDEVGYNRMQSDFRCINLCMPRTLLGPLIGDPARSLMRPIDAGNPALRLLIDYAAAIQPKIPSAPAALRRAIVNHIHDLTALTIGANRDAAETARGRGVRAARLLAIKTDIDGLIGRVEPTPELLTRRHRVSERYLRRLFELDGRSLSGFVLDRKLVRAWRLLTDPERAWQSITAIAFDAGFNDLSWFNRTFRRHYGMTPSDVRAGARHGDGATRLALPPLSH